MVKEHCRIQLDIVTIECISRSLLSTMQGLTHLAHAEHRTMNDEVTTSS